jgi:hypothetical protein
MGRWVIKRWAEQAVDGLRKMLAETRNARGAPPLPPSRENGSGRLALT